MKFERFEDIIAWQKSKDLAERIYRTKTIQKDFAFRDQVWRAAISVMNNIAEGFERKSNKEFSQFLFISKGSAGEVRSMIILGESIGLIEKANASEMKALSREISYMLSSLINTLK